MALNMQTLKTRSLTAAVFVVVMLVGLLWNKWSFFILFSVIHFGCWMEYQKLVGLIDPEYADITPFHKWVVMLTGWCAMLFAAGDAYHIGSLSLGSIGWWLGLVFVLILPVIEFLFTREVSLKNIGYSVLGLLYISMSWALMIDLSLYKTPLGNNRKRVGNFCIHSHFDHPEYLDQRHHGLHSRFHDRQNALLIHLTQKNLGRHRGRCYPLCGRHYVVASIIPAMETPVGYCRYLCSCGHSRRPAGKQAQTHGRRKRQWPDHARPRRIFRPF